MNDRKLIRWANPATPQACLEYSHNGYEWKAYTNHPLACPDYIDGGSPGYATMQVLLKAGYCFGS